MNPSDFTDDAPGKLVRTTFVDRIWQSDQWVAEDSEGWAFIPDSLPPEIDTAGLLPELYPQIVAAERALSLLEGTARRLPNPHLLIGVFARREAIRSSAIENTFASAEEIALFDQDPSAVESRGEIREVANYVRALEAGLSSELPICRRLILELHATLLEGARAEQGIRPGHFRQTQNAIGVGRRFKDAKFVPPPASTIDGLIDNLEKYVNAEDALTPRLIRFAVAHYQFETIHPFADGNGRLGRLLITLMLCRHGQLTQPLVYVSGYLEANRDQYMDLLFRVSTEGAWRDWFGFFIEAIATQAYDAVQRADRLIDLQTEYYSRVRQKRASAQLPKLVDRLFINPSTTIAEAEQYLGCSNQSARSLVNQLVKKGILTEATGRDYGRVYIAPGILQLISD